MNKEEIVAKVSNETGLRQTIVSAVVESLLNNITDELANGNKVQFMGFGTFEPKKKATRVGRNLHTNEPIPIPPRIVPSFKAGNRLKAEVEKVLN